VSLTPFIEKDQQDVRREPAGELRQQAVISVRRRTSDAMQCANACALHLFGIGAAR
jgi:hypothetical protein